MKNNLLSNTIERFSNAINKGGADLEKKCTDLSSLISKVIQSKDNKIIFVSVGGTSKLIKGLKWDIKYNLGIDEDKILVLNPGESFKDYILDWESIGDERSIAPIELENAGLQLGDLVIGVSSSGTNEFVQGAINFAKDLGCETALITNNGSNVENSNVDFKIVLEIDGYEIEDLRSFEGSTSLKLIIDSIIMNAAIDAGRIYKDKLIFKKWNSESTKQQCIRIVMDIANVDEETANRLFTESGGVQSIAIIMHDRGYDREKSLKLLKDNNFNFNNVLK